MMILNQYGRVANPFRPGFQPPPEEQEQEEDKKYGSEEAKEENV